MSKKEANAKLPDSQLARHLPPDAPPMGNWSITAQACFLPCVMLRGGGCT
eukprot:CAMPEP_0177402902 /NCGR_PEP_ID=MMETSP0368-20130122/60509_1 /TAXON_ID=447022 ORGANISM="Scrippsiella hangoei-like, Strain SHHI-4" /NCGR_SAMPLE_ID=MMETSP0368 /ASSEMBLY_ACC=CAM_ASM_000363 /LENGTH=49 /DNA_ID= /DNA_START= /DNA_END= /DNA_ORIENTATION=